MLLNKGVQTQGIDFRGTYGKVSFVATFFRRPHRVTDPKLTQ